jgi:hypothetical protein
VNTYPVFGDTEVSPAGQRAVSSNLWSTGRILRRPAQMPVGGQVKSPTAFRIRTLRALERAHFKSVLVELDREDVVLPEDHETPSSFRQILEKLPTGGRVN